MRTSVPSPEAGPEERAGVIFPIIGTIARRWDCVSETVRRIAHQEGWSPIRIGGRMVRYRLSDIEAYEARCTGLRHQPVTPVRRETAAA